MAVGDISESAAAVPSAVTFQEPLEPRKRRIYTENDMKTRLAEARDTDKRTIEALIQELNRLEAQQRGKGVETRDESVEAHLPDTQTAANRPGTISPSMDASTETKNDRWSPPNSVVVIPSLVIASAIFLYTMNQLYMHIRSSSPNPR